MKQGRTYRVPKKVADRVKIGMREYVANGMRAEDMRDLEIAKILTSDTPIDVASAERVNAFFTHDWMFDPDKVRIAPLYGGDDGCSWALKCVTAAGLVAAGDRLDERPFEGLSDEEIEDLFKYTDEDVAMMLRYGEGPEVEQNPVEETEDGEASASEAAEIDVADTDAENIESTDMIPDTATGVETFSDDDLDGVVEEDMTVSAMQEAVTTATLQVEDVGAPEDESDVPTDGGPSDDHHAEHQLRDYHGRFAKVGARVQGRGGNLGWVKGADGDGNAVVTLDDGNEVTVDPGEMQVVSVKGRASLPPNPNVVEDIGSRLEAYSAWAQEQLHKGEAVGGSSAQ